MKSKLGLILSGAYVLIAIYLVSTQGLTGESFISIILGLPWTLALSFVEFGGAEGFLLIILLIAPMALNAYFLYKIGSYFSQDKTI